jgi:ABC-type multidrug transport system ATPase subunit
MVKATADSAVAVQASGLTKVYGSKQVLSDLNFEIRVGERCCFVGANGSGKSTLLEIIMGLKVASGGRIEVLGRKPSDPWLKERRVILMDRPSFPYYAKVREIIHLYSGFYSKVVDAQTLLQSFELDGGSYVRHLSKGQKQRMGLLLTLLGNPQLVLLDEPSSGLDPQARLKLWQSMETRMAEDPQPTLIFASHDLAEAERWADRIGILHHGRLIAFCSPEEHCRSVIGSRRKLTIVGKPGFDVAQWRTEDVKSVALLGSEIALYTDQPERVLGKIGLAGDSVDIRIESVSVRDAFFKLTGEVPDGASTLAFQKSG